jgi:hypothetical protein
MYVTFLVLHSLLRWLVLLFGVLALVRALGGWFGGRPWTRADDRAGLLYMISLDTQTLVGLILYGLLSPITQTAFSDFGAAMKDALLRFYAVEHVTLMLVGLAFVHIGRARAKRAPTDTGKHRTAAIFYTLGFVLILAGIPWPFRTVGRPVLPSF